MLIFSLLSCAAAVPLARAAAHSHMGPHRGEDLLEGRLETERLLSLIYNRYEMFDSSLYGIYLIRPYLNMDMHTWDLLKYKYAHKILTGEDFMCIFAGSSVTAGHDNFLNESYPMVYERRMAGPLRALGIELKVISPLHKYICLCLCLCFRPSKAYNSTALMAYTICRCTTSPWAEPAASRRTCATRRRAGTTPT
jgi:hypothetical protein